MRTPSFEDIQRAILRVIQPLYSGTMQSISGLKATISDVVPFGTSAQSQQAFPFGFVSAPFKGVGAYVLNLYGKALAPVILAHLDKLRPIPSAPGEVIVYCTAADGSSIPIKLALGNDGTLVITANTKVQVLCDDVEIGTGTLEKLLDGETFQSFFNAHVHLGNAGVPTGPPTVASGSPHLSTQVKASK